MHYVSEKFTVYQTLTHSDNITPCYYFGICYRICCALCYCLSGFLISLIETMITEWSLIKKNYIINPSCLGSRHLEMLFEKKWSQNLLLKVRDIWSYFTSSLVVLSVTHSEPWWTSVMELFELIANGFKPFYRIFYQFFLKN